jgi:hypothetical protein
VLFNYLQILAKEVKLQRKQMVELEQRATKAERESKTVALLEEIAARKAADASSAAESPADKAEERANAGLTPLTFPNSASHAVPA